MARIKELEKENTRPKRMYADVQIRHDVLQEALKKTDEAAQRVAMAKRAVSRRKDALTHLNKYRGERPNPNLLIDRRVKGFSDGCPGNMAIVVLFALTI